MKTLKFCLLVEINLFLRIPVISILLPSYNFVIDKTWGLSVFSISFYLYCWKSPFFPCDPLYLTSAPPSPRPSPCLQYFLQTSFCFAHEELFLRINAFSNCLRPTPQSFLYPSKCCIIRLVWLRKILLLGKVRENCKERKTWLRKICKTQACPQGNQF